MAPKKLHAMWYSQNLNRCEGGNMKLEGKVVVITGATGVLGGEAARAFGEQGAKLALVSSDQSKLDALLGELALPKGQAIAWRADLRDPAAVQAAVEDIGARLGPPQ